MIQFILGNNKNLDKEVFMGDFFSKLEERDTPVAVSLIKKVNGFLRGSDLIIFIKKEHELKADQLKVVDSILTQANTTVCEVINLRTKSFWNSNRHK